MSEFMQMPIIQFLLFVGGVIGIVSFVDAKRNNPKKQIAYTQKYLPIINANYVKKIPLLHIFYMSNKIESLEITNFIFWNLGNQTIKKDDLARALMIKSSNGTEILTAEILYSNHKENQVKIISQNKDEIELDFFFLNVKDGCVIKIVHTGDSNNLRLDSDFIGEAKIKCMESEKKDLLDDNGLFFKSIEIVFLVGMVCMMFFCFYNAYMFSEKYLTGYQINNNENFEKVNVAFNFIYSTIMCFIYAYVVNYRYDLKIPKGLRKKASQRV